jgi:SAM-dependent methyltransferase
MGIIDRAWPKTDNRLLMARYTFGDDEAALKRLELVAAAYAPVSRKFVTDNAPRCPKVALDLGCGPAFSTQLLAEISAPATLIGIDSSSRFLDIAHSRLPGAHFPVHDVATTPLPGAPADVIYARLLLSHLPHPLDTARRWISDLAAGGVLLIEDLEHIEAPPGPLQTYDHISADIVKGAGGLMYAGAALSALGGRHAAVTVPAALAARIYLFNVMRWRQDPTTPPTDELARLQADLTTIMHDDNGATVSWIVRQIAVHT